MVGVEVFEAAGHRPGIQVDLDLSDDMIHWTRGWFQRVVTNSQPNDPSNSVRELFTTFMRPTNAWFARAAVTMLRLEGRRRIIMWRRTGVIRIPARVRTLRF